MIPRTLHVIIGAALVPEASSSRSRGSLREGTQIYDAILIDEAVAPSSPDRS